MIAVVASGCAPRTAPLVRVASTPASRLVAGGVTLVVPPRICLDIQIDDVRKNRAGVRGLVLTRAGASALTQALGAPSVMRECEDAIDAEVPSASLGAVHATPDLLARIERAQATRTVVTEISTRLLCGRGRHASIEARCVEDEVTVSLLVLDQNGRAIHVAGVSLDYPDMARSAVTALLGTFASGAPGSAGVGGPCRWAPGDILDCT